ncbi:uncharacterized protein FN964_016665 isoform 6-T11 [Alca torda]
MAGRWKRARGGSGRKRGPAGGSSAGPGRAGPGARARREHVVKHVERVKNVKCQRFSVVALLLCGDSGGQPERIRSALRVRGSPSASREENPAWLMAFAARNVKCQRFSVVALLLCGDSGGQPERIRSALRVRGDRGQRRDTEEPGQSGVLLLRVFQAFPRSISSLVTSDGDS